MESSDDQIEIEYKILQLRTTTEQTDIFFWGRRARQASATEAASSSSDDSQIKTSSRIESR